MRVKVPCTVIGILAGMMNPIWRWAQGLQPLISTLEDCDQFVLTLNSK
jgi:hypothetical protein